MSQVPQREDVEALFIKCDANGDGVLQQSELREIFRELELELDEDEFKTVFD